jgi:hypothetical protein
MDPILTESKLCSPSLDELDRRADNICREADDGIVVALDIISVALAQLIIRKSILPIRAQIREFSSDGTTVEDPTLNA